MPDERRCWLPNHKEDFWTPGLGTECDNPEAKEQMPETPPSEFSKTQTETSSSDMGAPDPPNEPPSAVAGSTPPPSAPPEKSPAQEYYDPKDPQPDYVIADKIAVDLNQQGVTQDNFEKILKKLLEDVIHNEPMHGLPHWDFGVGNREKPATVVDPVIIFTGRYSLNVTDIQIPSRGFPLQLTRIYQSGPVYFGPLGYNWDHNYNIYLRELSDGGAAIWTGNLKEDVYKPNPDGCFEPPIGVFRKLERVSATPLIPDRYVLSDIEGMQHIFERPSSWPHSDRIPLVCIEDRHGNAHRLFYDVEGRLERIEDHAGRFIKFKYNDYGLIEQVSDQTTDTTGRFWKYVYDPEIEHLVAVTTPSTPEYPNGLTTSYEYDRFRKHPALLHNLIRVIDPAGQAVVENRYGDDPDTDDFGRVVYQEFGGFEATFHATHLQYVPRTPEAINVPAWRVEAVDPGVLQIYTFNYRGDLLDERLRLVLDGSYRLIARTYRYDEQGNLIESRQPNGLGFLQEYDIENPDPRARGSLLKIELVAPLSKPAPSRIIRLNTYEHKFHRLKTSQDEAGNVTILIYDYEEMIGTKGDVVHIKYPEVTLPDGTKQTSMERYEYNHVGQIKEYTSGEGRRTSFEYHDSGNGIGLLKKITKNHDITHFTEEYSYDEFGNIESVENGLGKFIKYEYDTLNNLRKVVLPEIDGKSAEYRYEYNKNNMVAKEFVPKGNYKDDNLSEDFIVHEYYYDVLGNLIKIVNFSNTSELSEIIHEREGEGRIIRTTNPIGQETVYIYDERGLVLEQVEFNSSKVPLKSVYHYDRNGNLNSVTTADGRKFDYDYDSWDRLICIRYPGLSKETRTKVDIKYKERDLIDEVTVRGISGLSSTIQVLSLQKYKYDNRGRLFESDNNGLIQTFFYDRDTLPIKKIDFRGGVESIEYDGLGNIIKVVDALNNKRYFNYDSANNLISVRDEFINSLNSSIESHEYQLRYDSRNRPSKVIDPFGNTVQTLFDDRNLQVGIINALGHETIILYDLNELPVGIENIFDDPSESIINKWERDKIGKILSYTDAEDNTTTFTFNEHNLVTCTKFPDDSKHYKKYYERSHLLNEEVTPNGNRISYIYNEIGDLSRISFIPGPNVQNTSDISYKFDGLERVVEIACGGMVIRRSYDPFGRILEESQDFKHLTREFDDVNRIIHFTFPNGRKDSIELDILGRISSIKFLQRGSDDVLGNNIPEGIRLVEYLYSGNRLAQKTYINGIKSQFYYDKANRLTGINHFDKEDTLIWGEKYLYDAANRKRMISREPFFDRSVFYDYDEKTRLSAAYDGISFSTLPVLDTQIEIDAYIAGINRTSALRSEEYILSKTDKRLGWQIKSGSEDRIIYTPVHNNLHQLTDLTMASASTSNKRKFDYDKNGNRISDNLFIYKYDCLDRLVEITRRSDGKVILEQVYDGENRIIQRKSNDSISTRNIYDGIREIQIEDEITGAIVEQTTYGESTDEIILKSIQSDNFIYHQNDINSLDAISDIHGEVIERFSYSSFGIPKAWSNDCIRETSLENTRVSPVFGGRPFLKNLNLYDYRERFYDQELGVFLERDLAGYRDSSSLYIYARHNPIMFIDPTGNWIESAWDIISLGIGIYSLQQNIREGNVVSAIIDGVGIVADGAALALPLIPGGAGAAIKAYRAGDLALTAGSRAYKLERTVRLGQAVDQTIGVGQGLYQSYQSFDEGSYWSGMFYLTMAGVGARGGMAKWYNAPSPRPRSPINHREAAFYPGQQGNIPFYSDGPWRSFGNTWRLLRDPNSNYRFRHIFKDNRYYSYNQRVKFPDPNVQYRRGDGYVSNIYWRASNGARGNSLQHTFFLNSSNMPNWAKNSGWNLVEVPQRINSWMGDNPWRNRMFRLQVISLMGISGYGSYQTTSEILNFSGENSLLSKAFSSGDLRNLPSSVEKKK